MDNSGINIQTDSIVLEEEIDPNYVPSDNEILEYAKWLGMDLEKDSDLLWISKVSDHSVSLKFENINQMSMASIKIGRFDGTSSKKLGIFVLL